MLFAFELYAFLTGNVIVTYTNIYTQILYIQVGMRFEYIRHSSIECLLCHFVSAKFLGILFRKYIDHISMCSINW